MSEGLVKIAAVGDTGTGYDPPETMFETVKGTLRAADLCFGQVERLYSERGTFQEQSMSLHGRQNARMATAYSSVPFDVLSVASNHSGDWGPDALADTVDTLQRLGIATIGAGHNLAEARKPAILTRKGLRIAFLGYCSVLLPQHWAAEDRAGCVPLRVKTYYEPYEYQPGAPARIVTVPNQSDLELMQEDVHRAKKEADLVIVSMHWGIHFVPKPLTTYQPLVGHAAIDAGACAVLGHHPHLLQGIEVYKGSVIFYGLGNFAFYRSPAARTAARPDHPYALPQGEYTFVEAYNKEIEPGYTYRFNQFWNESIGAFLDVDQRGIKKATILPVVMNSETQPVIVAPNTDKFEQIRRYLLWASDGIKGGIEGLPVEGDRMVVFERPN